MATDTLETLDVPNVRQVIQSYLGTSYADMDCWQLARALYEDGLSITLPADHLQAAPLFHEVWYKQDDASDFREFIQPWDLVIFATAGSGSQHLAVVADHEFMAHSREGRGVTLERLNILDRTLIQVIRYNDWFDTRTPSPLSAKTREANWNEHALTDIQGVRTLVSPVRSGDGKYRYFYQSFKPGQTLQDYTNPYIRYERILVNGQAVDSEYWDSTLVDEADCVTMIPQWGELTTTQLILVAIAIALSLTQRYLLAPSNPSPPERDPTYGIDGIQSTSGEGRPIQVIYGEMRIGPHFFSRSVINDNVFLDNGQADATRQIENIVGGTPASDDVGGQGFGVAITITNHGLNPEQSVIIEGVQGKDRINKTWRVLIQNANTFGLQNSEGVDGRPWVPGTGTVRTTGLRIIQVLAGQSGFAMLGGIGHGVINNVLVNTTEINGQPLANFPDIDPPKFTLGTTPQAAIDGASDVRNSILDGTELDVDTEHIYTTSEAVTGFAANFTFGQGLARFTDDGNMLINSVDIRYRYRVNGTGTWVGERVLRIRGQSVEAVRFSIERIPLASAIYDISVTMSAPFASSLIDRYIPTLTSVTEIKPSPSTYDGIALFYIRGTSSQDVQGQFPNVTVVVQGRRVRVGSLGASETYSTNPAWCTMDYLTNTTYGIGIPDGAIDLPAFSTWASYSAELFAGNLPRNALNMNIDTRQSEQGILEDLMRSSGVKMLQSLGKFSPRVTRADLPVDIINWSSVRNFQVDGVKNEQGINVIEVRYWNRLDNHEEARFFWPPKDSWPDPYTIHSVELRGTTDPFEVQRFAEYTLKQFQLPSFAVQFEMPIEGLTFQEHDVIGIAHQYINLGLGYGGRVKAGAQNSNTRFDIDQEIEIEAGIPYHVKVTHPERTSHGGGAYEVRSVNLPIGTHRHISIVGSNPFSFVPNNSQYLWALGQSVPDVTNKIVRIQQRELVDGGFIRIRALDDDPDLYTLSPAGSAPPTTTKPNLNGPPPPIVEHAIFEVATPKPDGSFNTRVALNWKIGPQTGSYAPYGSAQILRREVTRSASVSFPRLGFTWVGSVIDDDERGGTGFRTITTTPGYDYDDLEVVVGLTYLYRVVPLSTRGVPNNVGYAEQVVSVQGATAEGFRPGPPQNLRLIVVGEGGVYVEPGLGEPGLFAVTTITYHGIDIEFRWDPPLGSEDLPRGFIKGYRVVMTKTGGAYTLVDAFITDTVFRYPREKNADDSRRVGLPGPQRDLTISVWAVTNTNLQSTAPATLRALNPEVDMSKVNLGVIALGSAAELNWSQFVPPVDLVKYDVLFDTFSPPKTLYDAQPQVHQRVGIFDLTVDTIYYARIRPWDTFGPSSDAGATPIVTFSIDGILLTQLDDTPPPKPDGLVLNAGVDTLPDGTTIPFVEARWNAVADPDGTAVFYQIDVRLATEPTPSSFVERSEENYKKITPLPGNTQVFVAVRALNTFYAASDPTDEVSVTTTRDTVAPGVVTGLNARALVLRTIVLTFIPPSDLDLAYIEVWAATSNNRNAAVRVGRPTGADFIHTSTAESGGQSLGDNQQWWYWVRAVDRSGNIGDWTPSTTTSTVTASTTQIGTGDLADVVPHISVGPTFPTNPEEGHIHIRDDLGYQIFTWDGLQWVANSLPPGPIDGTQILPNAILTQHIAANQIQAHHILANQITAGKIQAGAIEASHIKANQITATHLTTGLLITTGAQIGNALITDAHITTLSASKITTGNLNVSVNLGVGQGVLLAGAARVLLVNDDNFVERVRLGRVGPGDTNYGLRLFNSAGVLMADFRDTGITAAGIQAGVIQSFHLVTTTAVITTAAQITTALIDTTHIKDAAIRFAHIGTAEIDTLHLRDGAITLNLDVTGAQTHTEVGPNVDQLVLQTSVGVTKPGILFVDLGCQCDMTWQSGALCTAQFRVYVNGIPGNYRVISMITDDNGSFGQSVSFSHHQPLTTPGSYVVQLRINTVGSSSLSRYFITRPTIVSSYIWK